jgi:hypothetical protein
VRALDRLKFEVSLDFALWILKIHPVSSFILSPPAAPQSGRPGKSRRFFASSKN